MNAEIVIFKPEQETPTRKCQIIHAKRALPITNWDGHFRRLFNLENLPG